MGADKGEIVVMLRPQNAKKMLSSYKKGKGMRLSLSPDELEETVRQGCGFFKNLKKYTGINKTDVIAAGKKLGKEAIQQGSVAIGTAIGSYMGDPMAGQMIGDTLGRAGSSMIDSVEPTKAGVKFDPSAGKKSVMRDAKKVAIEALDEQLDRLPPQYRAIAENALAAKFPDSADAIRETHSMGGYGIRGGRLKKGSAEAKQRMAMLRERKAGGKINVGKAFKNLGKDLRREVVNPSVDALSSKQAMAVYKEIGKHAIEQGIPIATALASMALGDPTGMSGAMVGNVAQQYASNAYEKKVGSGRPRGRPRKQGGALAVMSRPYKQALKLNKATYGVSVGGFSSDSNAPISDFSTNPRVRPSSSEMTLSPYQNMSSPAMNPFIPSTYRQEGGTTCGYGGRGLYAGGLF
ncbi:MAG: hypothetical protein ACRCZ2_07515 [Fusobacteriaceae bacterium]